MSRPTIKVAICGGGIGGLVLAAALSRVKHIEVDVYEAARAFGEVGAGVGVLPRAWRVLQALGLADVLSTVVMIPPADTPAMCFRKGDLPDGVFDFHELVMPGGLITIYRPDLQRVLLAHLASTSVRVHTSARLASHAQTGATAPIELAFADGATATCDLLVGADGLKSCVRAEMLRAVAETHRARGEHAQADEALGKIEPRWSGTMAYRTTIPADVLRERWPGHRTLTTSYAYLGKNTQVTTYPIADGTSINLGAYVARYDLADTSPGCPWVQDVPRTTFTADFASWEPEVLTLFECASSTSRWAVHTVMPLDNFTHGRIVLLGDAAHAMMPYQGSGAGQAIEDAYVLAALLAHPSTRADTLTRACAAYDALRRPASQHVAAQSHEAGVLFTFNDPRVSEPRDVGERLQRNWAWAWETSAEEDVRRAVGMLEGEIRSNFAYLSHRADHTQ